MKRPSENEGGDHSDVADKVALSSKFILNTEGLENGMYTLRISSNQYNEVMKFVKSN